MTTLFCQAIKLPVLTGRYANKRANILIFQCQDRPIKPVWGAFSLNDKDLKKSVISGSDFAL
jgi:hypothetical protein